MGISLTVILLFLTQVPASDFSGYALNLVRELYGPLRAAVKGHLTGPGTLGTVMLCKCLLSFLPTGCHLNQPYRALKANDIVPFGRLRLTRKIDLRRFARTVNGILYVRRPVVERIWIQMSSLPASARATAAAVLSFLEKLKAGPRSKGAICKAATIIVDQFQHDLCEMGVVHDPYVFKGTSSVCIQDALTAEEYMSRVFDRPEQLPSVMSTRAFLNTALDLFPPSQLHAKITDSLLIRVKLVPQATVHARAVNFSSSFCTVIVGGPMSAAMSPDDTHRLVVAASQLIKENFVVSKNSLAQCLQFRPRLIQCVRQAIMKASSRTNGRLCHILAVVAYATMMLADRERIVPKRPNFKKLRMKTNLYRYILMDEMKEIVRTMDTEVMVNQEEVPKERRQIALRCIPECRVVVSRIAH